MKTSDNQIVCLVQYDNTKLVIDKYKIKDNRIRLTNYDDEGAYYEFKDVKILNTYVVNLYANFIYKESLTDPLMSSRGGGFSNPAGLKYFYNVFIVSICGDYETIIYSDNGVKSTRFGMYSYTVRPLTLTEPTQYNTESILYELYQSLDLNKILN